MDFSSLDFTSSLYAMSLLLAIVTIVGGFTVKKIVLPNLDRRYSLEATAVSANAALTAKLDEIHKQVTQNHHSNETPTLLDRLDDLEQAIGRVDTKVDKLDDKVDAHLISAAAVDATVAARVKALEQRIDRAGF